LRLRQAEPTAQVQTLGSRVDDKSGLLTVAATKALWGRVAGEAAAIDAEQRELFRFTVLTGGRRHNGRSAKFRQNVARFRLYRHRFLQENTRFAAFFKIYQII
jgi:hypothetical protein